MKQRLSSKQEEFCTSPCAESLLHIPLCTWLIFAAHFAWLVPLPYGYPLDKASSQINLLFVPHGKKQAFVEGSSSELRCLVWDQMSDPLAQPPSPDYGPSSKFRTSSSFSDSWRLRLRLRCLNVGVCVWTITKNAFTIRAAGGNAISRAKGDEHALHLPWGRLNPSPGFSDCKDMGYKEKLINSCILNKSWHQNGLLVC